MSDAGRAIWEILHWVKEGSLMGGFNGYWDDSDDLEGAIAVAGYVAPCASWKIFDPMWNSELALADIPYLHMKELNYAAGAFKYWDKNDPAVKQKIAAILDALAKVIGSADLKGFGATVPLAGIRRFNQEKAFKVSPKAIAILCASIEMQDSFNGEDDVSILLDKTNDAHKSIGMAEDYFNALYRDDSSAKFPTITAIPQNSAQCAKNTPALQAADFYAWELRKSYVNKIEFYESRPPPRPEHPGVTQRLMSWFIENRRQYIKSHGMASIIIPLEPDRRSFIALDAATINRAHIWDYSALNLLHENGAFD